MRNTISDMAIIMSRGPMIEPSTMLSALEGLGEGRIGIAGETVGYHVDGCGCRGQGSKSDSSGRYKGLYEVVHRSVCNGGHLHVRTTRT